MHVLGIWHEHSRKDRDKFVKIHWGNVRPGLESNFEKKPDGLLCSGYDYCSVMHYDKTTFSVSTLVLEDPTLTCSLTEE